MAPLVRTRRRPTSTASVRILPRILSQGFIPRFPAKPFELSGGNPLERWLGGILGLTPEDDIKAPADDWHLWLSGVPNPLALPPEACPVSLLPVLKRTITFALCRGKFFRDFIECHDIDPPCFDDAKRSLGQLVTTLRSPTLGIGIDASSKDQTRPFI